MKTIRIENNFARVCPGLKIGIIGAQVTNTETDPRLWEQIDDEASRIAAAYKIDEINKRPALSVRDTPSGLSMPIVSKETLSSWESGKKEKSSEVLAGAFSISKGSRFTATIKEV